MDRLSFAELLKSVRERPGMWLADERYTTLVAFVVGCDAGTGGKLLVGLNQWLAHRYLGHETSIVWWGLVADHVAPHHPESRTYLGDLDEIASRPFNTELFDRVLDFVSHEA